MLPVDGLGGGKPVQYARIDDQYNRQRSCRRVPADERHFDGRVPLVYRDGMETNIGETIFICR